MNDLMKAGLVMLFLGIPSYETHAKENDADGQPHQATDGSPGVSGVYSPDPSTLSPAAEPTIDGFNDPTSGPDTERPVDAGGDSKMPDMRGQHGS